MPIFFAGDLPRDVKAAAATAAALTVAAGGLGRQRPILDDADGL